MSSTVLITGSSGFLGRALCHHFENKGVTVIGFDMEGPPSPPTATETYFCDLTSDESVQKTFFMVKSATKRIDAVIHLAAYYSFSGKHSHLYEDLTVKGTERLLRELKKFDVGQFIFSSSMLVYKPNEPGHKLKEESPCEPTWDYPKSKVTTEKLLQREHGNLPTVSLRIAGVYDDLCQSIPLAHQIQRIYEKQFESHMYSGSTAVRQAFVHVDDVVSACEAVMNNADKLPNYSVFNIGEEDAMSYDEIQQAIGELLYKEHWTTIQVPIPIAKTGAWVENALPTKDKPFIKPWMIDHAGDNYELSMEKARAELGWKPAHSLRATLPKMLEGLVVDPQRWYKINNLKPSEKVKEHHEPNGANAAEPSLSKLKK